MINMKKTILRLGSSTIIVIFVYALIWNRELPKAVAAVTDCSTDLDQADTIYQLSTTTAGNCIITANNITIDGQGLYSINGNVQSTGGHNIVVTDVVNISGFVQSYNATGNSGDIEVINTEVGAYVSSYSYDSNAGEIYIQNSNIGGGVYSIVGASAGTAGDITVIDSSVSSSVVSNVSSLGSDDSGNVVIENSIINSSIASVSDTSNSGNITISNNSTVTGSVRASGILSSGDIDISDSEVTELVQSEATGGDSGDIEITDSNVTDYVESDGSLNSGSVSIYGSDIGGQVQSVGYSGNGGTIVVNDSYVDGYIYSAGGIDAGDVTVTDSEVTLGVSSFTYGNDGGDVIVTNSTIGNYVSSYGYSGASGDVTVINSTVFANSYSRGVTASTNSGTEGNVFITDSNISGYVSGNELTLIDNPPNLTVTPLDVEIDFNDSFTIDFGTVSANDIKDGNLNDDIEVTGEVLEDPGVYELLYSVTDSGTVVDFNGSPVVAASSTVTTTRTVTREAKESSGSSGTSAKGRAKNLRDNGNIEAAVELEEKFNIPATPISLSITLDRLRQDLALIIARYRDLTGIDLTPVPLPIRDLTLEDEGPDVTALQELLISLSYSIPAGATGYFGPETAKALSNYQIIHGITPATGYFGEMTRAEMKKTLGNRIWW